MFKQITVLGMGLLGSSVMRCARARAVAERLVGWSPSVAERTDCLKEPWCDAVFDTPEEAVREADLVVLAIPVHAMEKVLRPCLKHMKENVLITDVGSTKKGVCDAMKSLSSHFVGSHPLAGSEKRGYKHGSAELFPGRTCVVTPVWGSDQNCVDSIIRFWEAMGMTARTMAPDKHDKVVASMSHLPHLLASTLCSYLASKDPEWNTLGGTGLSSTTRVASGNPELWAGITNNNRKEILETLAGFKEELNKLYYMIELKQDKKLLELLERGKAYHDGLCD